MEKEREEAVRKAHVEERSEIKSEHDAVQNFMGKILEENDALQDKVRCVCVEMCKFRCVGVQNT